MRSCPTGSAPPCAGARHIALANARRDRSATSSATRTTCDDAPAKSPRPAVRCTPIHVVADEELDPPARSMLAVDPEDASISRPFVAESRAAYVERFGDVAAAAGSELARRRACRTRWPRSPSRSREWSGVSPASALGAARGRHRCARRGAMSFAAPLFAWVAAGARAGDDCAAPACRGGDRLQSPLPTARFAPEDPVRTVSRAIRPADLRAARASSRAVVSRRRSRSLVRRSTSKRQGKASVVLVRSYFRRAPWRYDRRQCASRLFGRATRSSCSTRRLERYRTPTRDSIVARHAGGWRGSDIGGARSGRSSREATQT